MDWVEGPQNYKDLYGILQLLQGSHLNNFPLKTLKLGWVAFRSVSYLKCLDFLINIRNSSQSSHVSAIGLQLPFHHFVLYLVNCFLSFCCDKMFYKMINM